MHSIDPVEMSGVKNRSRPSDRSRALAWARYASIGIALAALPASFLYSNDLFLEKSVLYQICGVTASVAILVGVWIHRPQRAFAWYLLAAGNILFVVGDVVYAALADSDGLTAFPSGADIPYLAAYPMLAAALVGLSGGSRRSRGSFIDACIIGIGVGLVGWVFLMEPYASDLSMTLSQRVFSIAYPLGDLILVATLSWFVFNKGQRNPSLNWLLISTGALLTSDVIYGVQVIDGSYVLGWVDAGWIVSYLAFGAAALHPSMKLLERDPKAGLVSNSRARLGFLAVSSLMGPAMIGVSATRDRTINLWLLGVGTGALFLLTFVRMAGLMLSVERKADRLKVLETARSHLMEAVHEAGEKERTSLALDLHDGPIQHLTALSYELEMASISLEKGNEAEIDAAFKTVEDGLSVEIDSLRLLMTDLRPPALDERGLEPALSDLVATFTTRTEIECQLNVRLESRLPAEIETVLFRIAQEALTNVAKHSGARRATVSCSSNGEVRMDIIDDGVGFDPSMTDMTGRDGHLGLASIKERIGYSDGTSSIQSRVGEGTWVSVTVVPGEVADAEITRIAS